MHGIFTAEESTIEVSEVGDNSHFLMRYFRIIFHCCIAQNICARYSCVGKSVTFLNRNLLVCAKFASLKTLIFALRAVILSKRYIKRIIHLSTFKTLMKGIIQLRLYDIMKAMTVPSILQMSDVLRCEMQCYMLHASK